MSLYAVYLVYIFVLLDFTDKGYFTMRRILTFFFSLISLLVICGCARQVIIAEALQQPVGSKVYLKQNIWYEDSEDISCLNIQEGEILPFGTEIEPVKVTDYRVSFKNKEGKLFVIKYDYSLMMVPMTAYIKQIFCLEDLAAQAKDMDKDTVKLMLSGKVKRGMTKKQVIMTCGVPLPCRTPSTINSTWVYWLGESSVYRVVFRKDKVNTIINIDNK
jgi:hypothetical protein